MTLQDLFLTPIYLVILFFVLLVIRSMMVKDLIIRKYFFPAVFLKIIGGISVGLAYYFYYQRGDTVLYFEGAGYIFKAIFEAPYKGLLLLVATDQLDPEIYEYTSQIMFFGDAQSYFIVKIAGILSLLSFNTYSIIAIFFALFSFSGTWALYLALYRMYPHLHKEFAISVFFIPSIFFWGSGILKDTVTLGALGWMFYSFSNIFIQRKQIKRSIIIFFISAFVISSIKVYILLCYIPAISVWLFSIFSGNIKSASTRAFLKPFLLISAILFGLIAGGQIVKDDQKYNLSKLATTSTETSAYLLEISKQENGSGYSLGEMDGSVSSFISKAPQAIWVTLYRPYLWEAKNIAMFLSALESFYFLILSIITFKKVGIGNAIRYIRTNDFLTFSFIFCLTFAFAIGISTANFGTLVRYKIPLLPFFLCSIYLLKSFAVDNKKINLKGR
jgi:hypothetical protein